MHATIQSSVCSILTYGPEAWRLTANEGVRGPKRLNDANSNMVIIVITGRSVREETTEDKRFDLVKWIPTRKLQ